ncbi:MAG: molybdopterin-dependent oxidoreductase [Acidobacteriota bacterium]
MTEFNSGRRRFLQTLGASTAAGAALTGTASPARAFDLLPVPEALPAERKVPTVCEICFWNCGLVAHARGNQVLEVRGHPAYPNARGKLCGRGNAGPGFFRDPDRLKYPMVRTGARGEGKFERVGWPTAYKLVADAFKRIKAKHGPRALALFYHGMGGPMLRTMMVALGSPNFAAPAYAQCKGPRDVGYKLTYGVTLPSPEPLDFAATRCMVLCGSHLGENAHNSQVQDLVQARARGAKLIVLDPRLSTVAAKADLWLSLRPGSDTAIILAWMHLLLANETYDRVFVEKQCVGFAELRAHVQSATPEWAAAQAGVPAAQIVRAYELIAAARPAVLIHPGRHVTWYGEADTQRARAQAILSALLGSFWRPGGTFRPSSPELRDFPAPDFPELPPNVDEASGRFPFAKECSTTGIRDATRTGKPYPIKGWYVHATNLMQCMPNVQETREAIAQLDLLVVCDVIPSEIVNWADVVLPECTYLERYDDLALGAGKEPYIGLRQPVVQSPYDTRPAWRIAKELGTELGVGDFFDFQSFEEYLEARLAGSGTTLDELKRTGIHLVAPKEEPYLDPAADHRWHTPSGKVELYSKQLADKGFAPLPSFQAEPPPPAGWLRLTYGRSPLHTFGRTQNNEVLFDIDPTNCVWLNPACAKAMGIRHGAPVIVENQRGDVTGPLPARITDRVQRQTIYMVHGFGHRSPALGLACCSGGSDTDVMRDYRVDPITGATGMRVQFVRLRPAAPGSEVKPCAMR